MTSPGFLVIALAGLGLGVWVLAKIGRALASMAEALAAMVVVFVGLWWACKVVFWLFSQVVIHWRTSLTVIAVYLWCIWVGWIWLVINLGGLALILGVWRLLDVTSFDQWCGRPLRSWWLRWAVYHLKLPGWLHACGLSVRDAALPVEVTVNLVGRRKASRATARQFGSPECRSPRSSGSGRARRGTRCGYGSCRG